MCLIVDTNVARAFFCGSALHYREILEAVLKGRCCIYYGGELRREYAQSSAILTQVLMLDRAGRAKVLPDKDIDALADVLRNANACKSDDSHVIALAQLSNCRLLCTNDQLLEQDFTDRHLLAKPRGKIYKNPSHRSLIGKHCRRC
jgi:predicted nucleic acid-binding protein